MNGSTEANRTTHHPQGRASRALVLIADVEEVPAAPHSVWHLPQLSRAPKLLVAPLLTCIRI